MKIFFPSGAETVNTSKYLLESGNSQILLDYGVFQNYKWLCECSRQPLIPDLSSKVLAICLPGEGIVYRAADNKPPFWNFFHCRSKKMIGVKNLFERLYLFYLRYLLIR